MLQPSALRLCFTLVLAGLANCTPPGDGDAGVDVVADATRVDSPQATEAAIADVRSDLPMCPVRCSGVCVMESTDVLNCGRCGNACVAPDHATAFCSGSSCGFACDTGFVRSGVTCVSTSDCGCDG